MSKVSFCHISDTHCHALAPIVKGFEADVLLISGDMSYIGSLREMSLFMNHLQEIRKSFGSVYWTMGNHERDVKKSPGIVREIEVQTNSTCLTDTWIVHEGIKIFGSPCTPRFGDWGWMYDRGTNRWDHLIQEGTDIIMTHGPCKNILDLCPDGFHAGCEDLLRRVQEVKPALHLAGHIHGAYGKYVDDLGITYLNSSICSEMYEPTHKPQVFEIEAKTT